MNPKSKDLLVASLVIGVMGAAMISQITYRERSITIRPLPYRLLYFSGQHAVQHVLNQVELGPRHPGSPGHQAVQRYIKQSLEEAGWHVERHQHSNNVLNMVGKREGTGESVLLLGTHYDTRLYADKDPDHPGQPVPGGNDGASGVAVLLELARVLADEETPNEIWLAFFDAEDQGGLDGHRWAEGATLEADFLERFDIALVIVVDMVGDADQQIFIERRSHQDTTRRLWNVAGELGYGEWFVPETRYRILDDHLPFARHGIPSVLVIDMDYAYHHTTADTADKVSPLSLERVGRTLEAFLKSSRID
jgi:glutaminyl-peptide cyclotransferase